MNNRMSGWMGIFAVAVCLALACSDDSASQSGRASAPNPAPAAPSAAAEAAKAASVPPPASEKETRSEAELVEAGRGVYMGNCTACHNIDATQDGALGPAVAGASEELLEARIVQGVYPEGYTPKRPTRVMVPLPHLEPKIAELTAYLNSL